MDVEYTWILRQGKNCFQFRLLTLKLFIGQFVHPVGGEGLKGESYVLAQCVFHFIGEHENLV